MPPLIYCDHNFLISLFDEGEQYKDNLRAIVSTGKIRLVFSMWHWVEMAKDKDHTHALALADFADSLNPLWIRERVSLHRDHMMAAFCSWGGIQYSLPPAVCSLPEMMANFSSRPLEKMSTLSSRQFVSGWRANSDSLAQMIIAHQRNVESFGWLKVHLRRVTREVDRARRAAVRGFLPEKTPAGLVIDQETKERFLRECDLTRCGTLATEIVISEEDWHFLGKLRWQHFIDRQHLVPALPHVDFFATNDKRLVSLVRRVRPKLPFNLAETLSRQAFESTFI